MQSNTEDWNNGCWKFNFAITGIYYTVKYIQIVLFYKLIIFHNITVSIRDFFQKHYIKKQ